MIACGLCHRCWHELCIISAGKVFSRCHKRTAIVQRGPETGARCEKRGNVTCQTVYFTPSSMVVVKIMFSNSDVILTTTYAVILSFGIYLWQTV
jgi:hypothetical protein